MLWSFCWSGSDRERVSVGQIYVIIRRLLIWLCSYGSNVRLHSSPAAVFSVFTSLSLSLSLSLTRSLSLSLSLSLTLAHSLSLSLSLTRSPLVFHSLPPPVSRLFLYTTLRSGHSCPSVKHTVYLSSETQIWCAVIQHGYMETFHSSALNCTKKSVKSRAFSNNNSSFQTFQEMNLQDFTVISDYQSSIL